MKFDHIALTVNNLRESIKFYTDMFGFKATESYLKNESGAKFVYMVGESGVRIELWEFPDMKENKDDLEDLKVRGLRHICFEVEDIEKTVAELKEKGFEFPEPEMGSSGRRYTLSKDPNGIAIELLEIKLT
jgi:glyoxylase I family protein